MNADRPEKRKLRGVVPFLAVAGALLPSAAAAAAAAPGEPYVCYRLDRAPKIDGDLSDWPGLPVILIGREQQVSAGHWAGPDDCHAAVRLGWTQTGLYFAIDVVDDHVMQDLPDGSARKIFKEDAIQWAVDIGGRGGQGYDTDDYEYGFGMAAGGPCVYRWFVSSGLLPGRTEEVTLAVRPKADGRGVVYEAEVPFEQLVPLRPSPEKTIGFTILVQDRDPKGRTTIAWRPGISGGKDPGQFGRLTFSSATAASADPRVHLSGRSKVTDQPTGYRVIVAGGVGATSGSWCLRDAAGRSVGEGDLAPGTADRGATVFTWQCVPKPLLPGKHTWSVQVTGRGIEKPLGARMTIERVAVERIPELRAEIATLAGRLRALMPQARARGVETAYAEAAITLGEVFDPLTDDDLKKDRHGLVLRNLDVLREGLEREAASLEGQLERGPRTDLRVPRPDMSKVVARDGGLYIGDEPVLLVGPMGWLWGLRRDWDKFGRLGFNAVRVGLPARNSYDKKGRFTAKKIPWWAMKGCVAASRSSNLAVSAAPFAPADILSVVARRNKPTMRTFRQEYQSYLDRWFRRMGTGHFFNYGIAVEGNRPRVEFESGEHLRAYRDWLRSEYATIGAYNKACGTRLADFAEADFPGKDEKQFARRYDRAAFRQKLAADTLKWAADEIRRRDPAARVCGYPSFLTFDDEGDFWSWDLDPVLDLEAYDLCDGDSGGPRTTPKYAIATMHWLAMYRDLMGGLAPGKAQLDSEFHFANERREYSRGWVPAIYFQTYIHGLSGSFFWVWVRSDHIGTAVLLEAGVCLELTRTALDLRRLAGEIAAFHRQPAEVALLYSHASAPHAASPPWKASPGQAAPVLSTHLRQMRIIYEGLFFEGVKVGFLSERRVAAGDFGKCRLLIVPAACAVSDRAVRQIEQYARKGGKVLLAGTCFATDRRGRKRPTVSGKGMLAVPAFADAEMARTALRPWLAKLDLCPPVTVVPAETPYPVVEWRYARGPGGQGELLYMLNTGHDPVEVKVLRSGRSVRGVDLITGQPFTGAAALESLGLRLLRLAGDD